MSASEHRGVAFVLGAVVLAAPVLAQSGPAPVAVARVVEQTVTAGKPFVGTVLPLRTSTVGSAVDGRLIELPVIEGERVVKGQPLARLLTKTLEIELAAAQAELQLRQEERAELEHGSRPEEIEAAQAAVLGAKARMEYAQKDFERVRGLFESSSAARDEMDEAVKEAQATEQEYLETKAAYDLAVAGPRAERIAQARAKVVMQSEQVNRIQDQIEKHTLIAPFDGYVTAKRSEVGAWVARADPVVEVVELDEVEIQAMVLEDYVGHVRLGMEARVAVDSLPNESFTGTVAKIVPQADTRSRSFPVHVRVENRLVSEQPLLKAGMLARVMLPVGQLEQAVLVPKDALVLGGASPSVFVVDPAAKDATSPAATEGAARLLPVEAGVAHGDLIQVKGDLKAGEFVVVRGNERLRPGQAVVISQVVEGSVAEETPVRHNSE